MKNERTALVIMATIVVALTVYVSILEHRIDRLEHKAKVSIDLITWLAEGKEI